MKIWVIFALLVPVVVAFLISAASRNFVACDVLDRLLDRLQDGAGFNAANKYLLGLYAPTDRERSGVELTRVPGVGAGAPDLDGVFLRNGPNPVSEHGYTKKYHWFDGHGYVHAVRIRSGGRATYSGQWLRTPRYELERREGKEVLPRFGEMVGGIGLMKALSVFGKKAELAGMRPFQSGQANTAMVTFSNRVFALHEASLPFEVTVAEDGQVSSVGYEDFGHLTMPMSAHPKVDPISGDLVFHGYSFEPTAPAPLSWGTLAASSSAEAPKVLNYDYVHPPKSDTVTGAGSFAHDMAATRTRVLLFDTSIRFDPAGIMVGAMLNFSPKSLARWGITSRHGDRTIQWFNFDVPKAMIHPLNAWDEEDLLVLWTPAGDGFDGRLGDEASAAFWYMCEFVFNVSSGDVSYRKVQPEGEELINVEFPRVHPAFNGLFAEYGFSGIMSNSNTALFTGIAKWQMVRGGGGVVKTVSFSEGVWGGEPMVAPKIMPAGVQANSDDVYLVTFINDERSGETHLVAYDGVTMELAAKWQVPHRVPIGFHAHWLGSDELAAHIARPAAA